MPPPPFFGDSFKMHERFCRFFFFLSIFCKNSQYRQHLRAIYWMSAFRHCMRQPSTCYGNRELSQVYHTPRQCLQSPAHNEDTTSHKSFVLLCPNCRHTLLQGSEEIHWHHKLNIPNCPWPVAQRHSQKVSECDYNSPALSHVKMIVFMRLVHMNTTTMSS